MGLGSGDRAMRKAVIVTLVTMMLGGCATTSVNKPCGVITDSLKDVHATTRDGERRISTHYEAGVAAGCWSR